MSGNFNYKIRLFEPDDIDQIIELLRLLWHGGLEQLKANFRWKYQDNPYAEKPLGVVAVCNQEVVAFRGYMATKWYIPSTCKYFKLLSPGDTCVAPEHRKKKLSVSMGRLAMEKFSDDSTLFLNTTCSYNSLPGYKKMGFYSLASKIFRSHYTLPGFLLYSTIHYKNNTPRPLPKAGNEISVSNEPRAIEMPAIISANSGDKNKLQLFRNEEFYRWRYANPLKKYIFYYAGSKGKTTAFMVIGLSDNGYRGYILDYGQSIPGAIEKILKFIIRSKYFDILSIYDFSIDNLLSIIFKKLNFREKGLLRIIEQKKSGDLPLLIRPVKSEFNNEDWSANGLDLRNIDNWLIHGIASDAA